MIIISIEGTSLKTIVDDARVDVSVDEDAQFLLEEWGTTEASITEGTCLEALQWLIESELSGYTTLSQMHPKMQTGEEGRFLRKILPKITEWRDTDKKIPLRHCDFVLDATGVKRYILIIMQEVMLFK